MKKKGSAYKRMLLSFVAVFCLPLCFVIVFFLYSNSIMESQMTESNEKLLEMVRSELDNDLDFYYNYLLTFSSDEDVQTYGSMEKLTYPTRDDLEDIEEFTKYIKDSRVAMYRFDEAVYDLFVYFPKIDQFASSKEKHFISSNAWYLGAFTGSEAEANEVFSLLNETTDFSVNQLDLGQRQDYLLLTRTCWQRDTDCAATAGILLNSESFSNKLSTIKWDFGFEWGIITQDGNLIAGSDYITALGDYLQVENLYEEKAYYTVDIASEVTDWQYILMVPREIVQQDVRQLHVLFVCSLALCVVFGIVVTKKTTVMNYAPLQHLMESFQPKKETTNRSKDEYTFIHEQIDALLTSKSSLQTKVSKTQKSLRNWSLVDILLKPYDRRANTVYHDCLQELKDGQNIVMLIREKAQSNGGTPIIDSDNLKTFIIDNVFSEKVGEKFTCNIVELDDYQALIVNDSSLDTKMDILLDIVYDLQSIIQEQFDLMVSVAGGGIHPGLEGLHLSYLEARETEDFIPILEQDCITYHEIRDNTVRKYDYPLQAEERIISAIQNNNVELAIAFVEHVLDLNIQDHRISAHMRRFLFDDIYCTILKAADEKCAVDRIPLGYHNISQLSLPEIKNHYAKIIESICDSTDTDVRYNSDRELCQRIYDYVISNYSSTELNISTTAQYFRMSPSNLSTIYKKETGKSLLKVINEVRVEKAVEFLKKGYSVVETAEKVGITESSSFIRLFKKYMGVTPGQIKHQLHDNQE